MTKAMTMKTKLGAMFMAMAMMLALGAGTAMAGGFGHHGHHGHHGKQWKKLTPEQRKAKKAERLAKLKTELGLSDAQTAQVKALFEKRHKEMRALKGNHRRGDWRKMTPEQRKAKKAEFRKRRQAHKAEMAKILTPAQMTKFEALKAQRREKRMARKMARMEKNLNLTPAQSAKVKVVFRDAKTKRKAIMKKHGFDRAKAKPELKALRKSTKQQLKQILNKDQLQKLKQMRRHRKGRHMRGGDAPMAG